MFPSPITERDVQPQRHRDSVTAGVPPIELWHSMIGALQQVARAIGPVMARVGAIASDSREGLPSKEQQLAGYGIRWATDPAYEAELAQELEVARRRRHADLPVGPVAQPVVPTIPAGGNLRWSLGTLLIRTGRRLQGEQPVKAMGCSTEGFILTPGPETVA